MVRPAVRTGLMCTLRLQMTDPDLQSHPLCKKPAVVIRYETSDVDTPTGTLY